MHDKQPKKRELKPPSYKLATFSVPQMTLREKYAYGQQHRKPTDHA